MAPRSAAPATAPTGDDSTRVLDGGFWLVLVLAVVLGALFLLSALLRGGPSPGDGAAGAVPAAGASASAPGDSVDVSAFLTPGVTKAPPLELVDQDAQPFTLASLQGSPTFVFFGYTHCPDVCPATIGTIGEAMEAARMPVRAVFASIDPGRDTPAWLREYAKYLPAGFVALTGTDATVRTAADAWGVRYARVETGTADGYAMSHTATVFLVDAAGTLRAAFPFGTGADAMVAVLHEVVANPIAVASVATPAVTPAATAAATATADSVRCRPRRAGRLDLGVVRPTEPGHPRALGRWDAHRRPGAATDRAARCPWPVILWGRPSRRPRSSRPVSPRSRTSPTWRSRPQGSGTSRSPRRWRV